MKKLILVLIKLYQKTISPDHGFIFPGSALLRCRFYPSCSQYTYEAVNRYGILKGILEGLRRILRCNPFSKGGVDPVKGNPVLLQKGRGADMLLVDQSSDGVDSN